jgi:hypothetical protein
VGRAVNAGLLDLLDRVDAALGAIDLGEVPATSPTARSAVRAVKVRVQNARLTLQEIRRRIERVGQETP